MLRIPFLSVSRETMVFLSDDVMIELKNEE